MTWTEFNICKICGQKLDKNHTYGKHRVSEKNYFSQSFSKKDLNTWELLDFKSPESYYQNDFIDKRSMSKWLKNNPDKVVEWCVGWIKRRAEIKQLEFLPSESELIGLQFPSLAGIYKTFGESCLKEILDKSGLKIRYDYFCDLKFDNVMRLNYLCDTREQEILKLSNFEVKKLNYGDYSIKENDKIYVEKKSLADMISTASSGYNRFIREIERCKKDKNYLIVLITEKYNNLLSFPYLPHLKHTKCSVDFILHQIRELIQNYPLNIQFLCVDGKVEAARVTERVFRFKNDISKIDLQYQYNCKNL